MPIIDCPTDAPARAYDLIELAVPGDTTAKISWPDLAQLCGFRAISDRPNALTRDACVRYFDAWAEDHAELFDAMAHGFTAAMLWSDAMPADPVCEECGEPIEPDPAGSVGVWHHSGDDGYDLNENHAPRPPENYTGETGGLEDRTPTPELRAQAMMLCMRFYAMAGETDVQAHMDAFGDPDGGHPGEYMGHTFYLDAGGHGVSFTDRAWRDDDPMTIVCKRLCDVARAFPEVEHLCAYELADGRVGL